MNQFMFPQQNMTTMGHYNFSNNQALTNKLVVNNIEEVKQYPVPPGGDYVFSHNTQPIIFRKTVDNYGQFKIEIYDIKLRPDNTDNQFVPLSAFEALKAEVDALKNKKEVANESSEP